MSRYDMPIEKECPHCNGRGYIDPPPSGQWGMPRWVSDDNQKMPCGRCQGRGCILVKDGKEVTQERRSGAVATQKQAEAPSASPYENHTSAGKVRPPDPELAARRVFALNIAVGIYRCSGGNSGPFGGGSAPEMRPDEVVPLAREIDFYLMGD